MSKLAEDPRDASLEAKFSLPNTWTQDSFDGLSTSGMFLSGLIMVTRNRFLAWPSVIFGLSSSINAHPLRTKEGGGSALPNLALCVMALFASYIPLLMISNFPKQTSTPL
ncbi:hypothetical protein MIND_01186000 [Mycena indigotica]|uniref:Uncharacterized protein n=1 Tax=Mycena indigotica TaxID=2126181 RepID=A0A8H6S7S4_9AGAR|nr:uncharacterized protein MIND_01186000 [Mycena indigotica]KAF7292870.1 hypothetical protein MIND_01186000 [Mycena indigotica]